MCRFAVNRFRQPSPRWDDATQGSFLAGDIQLVHDSLPEYEPTPLVDLCALARRLGVRRVFVKDESHRFGLKAFKALGASYALFRFARKQVAKENAVALDPVGFYAGKRILVPGRYTFCTATDGNHGRGVAWSARKLRQKSVVFMPENATKSRIENIETENAVVHVIDGSYDRAVELCARQAARHGWQIISDTAWEGYTEVPRWIMAGYLTLFREIDDQLGKTGADVVLVPAGVGALAGAAAWHYRSGSPGLPVKLVSVEPIEAACMLESIESGGEPVTARGSLSSVMAGLNCGRPSLVAWPLIKYGFDLLMTISDQSVRRAMRTYYHPAGDDRRIISGESGASGLAALLTLIEDDRMAGARAALGIGPGSSVLLLNTEGDTDPEFFRQVVS